MTGKTDVFKDEWLDFIFQDRNKAYGAYELRKKYPKNVLIALIFSVIFFVLTLCAPTIYSYFVSGIEDASKIKNVEVTDLLEPPPIDETEPPPPPVEPPPPLKTTIKFTPPKIVEPEEVPDEPLPTQEQLETVEAGVETKEGDENGIDESLLEATEAVGTEPAVEQVFTIVEQMPEFPGGDAALFKFLSSKIKYPVMAKENGISGTVYISFVVDKEGKVTETKVVRGFDRQCDQEAVRVINSLPPWKPGKQNGKAVMVQYTVPVRFVLN